MKSAKFCLLAALLGLLYGCAAVSSKVAVKAQQKPLCDITRSGTDCTK